MDLLHFFCDEFPNHWRDREKQPNRMTGGILMLLARFGQGFLLLGFIVPILWFEYRAVFIRASGRR